MSDEALKNMIENNSARISRLTTIVEGEHGGNGLSGNVREALWRLQHIEKKIDTGQAMDAKQLAASAEHWWDVKKMVLAGVIALVFQVISLALAMGITAWVRSVI